MAELLMNQNPEQLARDTIDKMLTASGWTVQSKKDFNLAASTGMVVRKYSNNFSLTCYITLDIIAECHRSVYKLLKQVLNYFDAFQIGLTVTLGNRTFGYFKKRIL